MGQYCPFSRPKAQVYTILSDGGREFCGRADHHPTSCSCSWRVEHRTTKVRRPQATALSNGCIARCWMNASVSKGRTTWYESVEQMQTDLDSYQNATTPAAASGPCAG